MRGGTLVLTACLAMAAAGCSSTHAVRSCDPSAAAGHAAEYLIARDNAKDLAGVLAGYTDDVTWYPPHDAPLHGIEAIRPRYEELFSSFAVALRPDVLEASGNGESGLVAGEWKVSHLVWNPR